jgi:hypothetical protein
MAVRLESSDSDKQGTFGRQTAVMSDTADGCSTIASDLSTDPTGKRRQPDGLVRHRD